MSARSITSASRRVSRGICAPPSRRSKRPWPSNLRTSDSSRTREPTFGRRAFWCKPRRPSRTPSARILRTRKPGALWKRFGHSGPLKAHKPRMPSIEAWGTTNVGRKRKHNEDAYALDVTDEGLFIVADGMGGHAAGEVASKITVDTVGEFIAATRQKEEATWPFKYNHELHFNSNRLAVAIEKANERVMAAVAAQPWLKGMGTTVVAGLLDGKILSLAHVGDSRAYLYRDGQLSRLTDDHSWVHEQVAAGILTEEEAKAHPLKNVVARALGGRSSVSPDLQELNFSPGDVFIFCSDGLTTMLSDEEIRDAVASEEDPQKLCNLLVEMANDKGGVDNITVVVARVNESEEPATAKSA